jgi:hypothetical protein
MSNYTKNTNFATKDTLPTGDAGKIVKGTEIDSEFNAIASAISSKADTASPTFTGTPAAPTATTGSNTTQIANTAYVKGEVDAATGALGTMSTQNKGAVDIEGGTIDATPIGATTASTVRGTTVTATTGFVGNLTGNVTGTVSGNAGTVTNGVYTTNFTSSNQSLTTDGYQKFPGGLIIQWCESASGSGERDISLSYPITFPNAVLQVVVGTDVDGNPGDLICQLISKTTSGCSIRFNGLGSNDNAKAIVFAIGY